MKVNFDTNDVSSIVNGTHPKLVECDRCHGYGSSLEEDADACSKCGGSGVVERGAK